MSDWLWEGKRPGDARFHGRFECSPTVRPADGEEIVRRYRERGAKFVSVIVDGETDGYRVRWIDASDERRVNIETCCAKPPAK